ncbi:unnamed protein product [Enterobius vermicularis]|uniref:SRCR domain-containing protein n=1 Tax=Enterobius vermicularis TaxID=51028 RepID=A0A0N4VHQ2_ENTVE|nr:unnamed protein product [Enterobius vermicularis]
MKNGGICRRETNEAQKCSEILGKRREWRLVVFFSSKNVQCDDGGDGVGVRCAAGDGGAGGAGAGSDDC